MICFAFDDFLLFFRLGLLLPPRLLVVVADVVLDMVRSYQWEVTASFTTTYFFVMVGWLASLKVKEEEEEVCGERQTQKRKGKGRMEASTLDLKSPMSAK